MKVQQGTINNFFSTADTRFIIPVYQRNYAWEKPQCAKMLSDIISIAKDVNKKHWLN